MRDVRRADPAGSRAYLLRVAAQIAAFDGYENLTANAIYKAAGRSFYQLYPGRGADRAQRCFLDAYDLMGAELTDAGAKVPRGADWIDSIENGIRALLARVGEDPVFARCAFVEVFSVGSAGIEQRSRLMDKFTALLLGRVPAKHRPPDAVAEAIVGAAWQVAHHYVAREATYQLPHLVDHVSYLTLAPLIGGEQAVERIVTARS